MGVKVEIPGVVLEMVSGEGRWRAYLLAGPKRQQCRHHRHCRRCCRHCRHVVVIDSGGIRGRVEVPWVVLEMVSGEW